MTWQAGAARPGDRQFQNGDAVPEKHAAGSAAEPDRRLVVGLQPVREAIRAHGSRLTRVLIEERDSERLAALARFAEAQGVGRIERVDRSTLDRLSRGVTHQGAAAVAPPLRVHGLEVCSKVPDLLAIALDGIQDPQNFGAVIRSAVALAMAPLIWAEHSSAPLTPATFRASAGAIEHATLVRVPSLRQALLELRGEAVEVVGLDPQASADVRELDLSGPTVLVIGSEHAGLGRATRRACSQLARLVRPRGVESFNASVASALALYSAIIQREIK
jgi:23S rRNA (guanosine2251-2'-O)-methyltransferase